MTIKIQVDQAIEVFVNVAPLISSADFVTIDETIAWNEAGMDLNWNFITTAGVVTQTNVVPTTGGSYDWAHVGNGMYKIEIPAALGASINNDTEGVGWFSGVCTGVLPWVSPRYECVPANVANSLVNGTDNLDVGAAESVTGAVGSVTGNIGGNVTGSVGSVVGNVGGNVVGSVASVTGAVGSVTGNVGGNVTGSVGSVVGGLNTGAGVITTLDGLDTAQDAQHATTQAAIAALNDFDPVLDVVAHVTLVDTTTTNTDMRGTDGANTVVPPSVAQFNARTLLAAQYGTAANQTNIETDTQDIQTRLPAALVGGRMNSNVSNIDAPSANTIADHTLRRTFANAWGSADGDVANFRSLVGAVAKLVNRLRVNAGVLTAYEDDDLTPVGTQTVTTDAAADPIVELDTT